MSFRSKLNKTYDTIQSHGKKTLRKLSQLTHHSKSSTHRQVSKIAERKNILGAQFFESTEGALWLRRLVVAVILIFGLQGNVGAGRISLFFHVLELTAFIGLSASSISRLKKQMMHYLRSYQQELQPLLDTLAAQIKIVAGADETFFDRLCILLFMDLSSGYIFVEEPSGNRTAETWTSRTDAWRKKFNAVLCLVSDRGKSLLKFADNISTKCISDLYHMQGAVVKVFKYAFNAKRKRLRKQKKQIKKTLDKLIARRGDTTLIAANQENLVEIDKRNTLINKGQNDYRQAVKEISLSTHPFNRQSEIKRSAELQAELSARLNTLRNIATLCQIQDKKKKLNYFENSTPGLSALVDLWWQWVDADIMDRECSDELTTWLQTKLLPVYYWKQQITKSRSSQSLRQYYETLYEKSKESLSADPLTTEHLRERWDSWAQHWVLKFQRSTSQVEGRNARTSESHHCLRGLSAVQIQSDVIIKNNWITRADNTTATERLFGIKPPNLFEWLVDRMPELPLPRKYKEKNSAFMFLQPTAPET